MTKIQDVVWASAITKLQVLNVYNSVTTEGNIEAFSLCCYLAPCWYSWAMFPQGPG